MLRLGGETITSADPATSSAAKGESLADSVRVIANYADIMVIRHPRDGAVKLAAEYSPIPVINGGDGSHEHPTQTLCDLFLLRKKNKRLKNLKVAISGDLRGSRTIHSFVYALARFGATIMPMAAKGMELPPHVDQRLREEFRCQMVSGSKGDGEAIDALYVTPEEPHQQSLFSGPELETDIDVVGKKVDAVYVTRFQKERWADKEQSYPKIDRKFLSEPKYSEASVHAPAAARRRARRRVRRRPPRRLFRAGRLRGAGSHGADRAPPRHQGQVAAQVRRAASSAAKYPLYDQPRPIGIHCANKNCIVHDPMEAQYVRNKFFVVKTQTAAECKLRCAYCENDIETFVVASRKNKWFAADPAALIRADEQHFKDLVLFATAADAAKAGFHSRRAAAEPKPRRRAGSKA